MSTSSSISCTSSSSSAAGSESAASDVASSTVSFFRFSEKSTAQNQFDMDCSHSTSFLESSGVSMSPSPSLSPAPSSSLLASLGQSSTDDDVQRALADFFRFTCGKSDEQAKQLANKFKQAEINGATLFLMDKEQMAGFFFRHQIPEGLAIRLHAALHPPSVYSSSSSSNSASAVSFVSVLNSLLDKDRLFDPRRISLGQRRTNDDLLNKGDFGPFLKFVGREKSMKQLFAKTAEMFSLISSTILTADGEVKLQFSSAQIKDKFQFLTCSGAPGIGKSRISREFASEEHINDEQLFNLKDVNGQIDSPQCQLKNTDEFKNLKQLLLNCARDGRRLGISYSYSSLIPSELKNPERSLALRILYEFFKYSLRSENSDVFPYEKFYDAFELKRVADVKLLDVMNYCVRKCAAKGIEETAPIKQVWILNMDEVQELLETTDTKLYLGKMLTAIRNVNANRDGHYIFPILTGKHTLNLHNAIRLSGGKFSQIQLQLLEQSEMKTVIEDLFLQCTRQLKARSLQRSQLQEQQQEVVSSSISTSSSLFSASLPSSSSSCSSHSPVECCKKLINSPEFENILRLLSGVPRHLEYFCLACAAKFHRNDSFADSLVEFFQTKPSPSSVALWQIFEKACSLLNRTYKYDDFVNQYRDIAADLLFKTLFPVPCTRGDTLQRYSLRRTASNNFGVRSTRRVNNSSNFAASAESDEMKRDIDMDHYLRPPDADHVRIEDLEQEGMVFLLEAKSPSPPACSASSSSSCSSASSSACAAESNPSESTNVCYTIRMSFILLHFLYKESKHNGSPIPSNPLLFLSRTLSPAQNEQSDVSIFLLKIFVMCSLYPESSSSVALSDLLPLDAMHKRRDYILKLPSQRKSFEVKKWPRRVTDNNWNTEKLQLEDSGYIGFHNGGSAPFGDSFLYTTPAVFIQSKQRVTCRRKKLGGYANEWVTADEVKLEHQKCNIHEEHLFVYITDQEMKDSERAKLADKEIMIDYRFHDKFFGPILAHRRLNCIDESDAEHVPIKLKGQKRKRHNSSALLPEKKVKEEENDNELEIKDDKESVSENDDRMMINGDDQEEEDDQDEEEKAPLRVKCGTVTDKAEQKKGGVAGVNMEE